MNTNEVISSDSHQLKEQLSFLETLRRKTQSLVDCKAALLSKTEILNRKKDLLEETIMEKQRLQREKRVLQEMLQSINQDLTSIGEAENALTKESRELEQSVERIKDEQYEPLHDQVNELRTKNGLQKLPHINQELEARMAKILEERRVKWQQQESESSFASAKKRCSGRSRRDRG
ncbi:hypothetical protein BDF20DRAFT_913355 [Mycotypha africana]|uniref:uncharacterized protein n=1 Tax=Mycotypha africana TaxID=64632 RepID=UPI0022FFF10F|nr:uncharacterized protein BDF20DRAFT_913355 [Mycotypha africana]KAI8979862.1 hypothetical protein BDF20DRAFT_913355 [Mycotypha africana]